MLTKDQILELRAQIEAELKEISAALSEKSKDSMELDQTCVGRLSRMDAMQQQAMASGMRERMLLRSRRLVAAWTRTEQGTFGTCCQCDEFIPIERLRSDLGTPFCSDCQEEIDQHREEKHRTR